MVCCPVGAASAAISSAAPALTGAVCANANTAAGPIENHESVLVQGAGPLGLYALAVALSLDLLSADCLDNVRDMIERFAGFVGPKRPVSEINEDV